MRRTSIWHWVCASLGMGLVLMGDLAGVLAALEGFGDYPEAPLVDLYGLAAPLLPCHDVGRCVLRPRRSLRSGI